MWHTGLVENHRLQIEHPSLFFLPLLITFFFAPSFSVLLPQKHQNSLPLETDILMTQTLNEKERMWKWKGPLLANDSGYWYIPVTWPLAKLARSLKATPTGNGINPQLGWSNSLLSLFRVWTTTSAILTEKNKGVRPQGLTEASLHVLPNWFNDCNYLLGCMFCRGRLMASKTYADRRKLGEGALSKRNYSAGKKSHKVAERDTSYWVGDIE